VPVLSPAALFIPCFITSLGNGLLLPNAVAGAVSVDAKATGTAAGVVGFLQMGIGAVVSYLSGWLTIGSALPTAILMCAMATAGWLAIWWGQRGKDISPQVEANRLH
jgi:MFS transporter, DHA1 family, multidrug resistance protein